MLQGLWIIGEVSAGVGDVRENELDHERLEPEALLLVLHFARPEFHDPRHLGKVRLLRRLALADKLEMERDVGLQERAVFLAHDIAVPILVAFVEDRNHVHIQPGTLE